jgi:hypothetical protein
LEGKVAILTQLRHKRLRRRCAVVGCGCSSGVEHNLAKVGVEGSNPFARSKFSHKINDLQPLKMRRAFFSPVLGSTGKQMNNFACSFAEPALTTLALIAGNSAPAD